MKKLLVISVAMLASMLSTIGLAQSEAGEYYNDRYCMTCHGVDGIGNEGVSARRLAGMEPWYLKRQLEAFRAGTRGLTKWMYRVPRCSQWLLSSVMKVFKTL